MARITTAKFKNALGDIDMAIETAEPFTFSPLDEELLLELEAVSKRKLRDTAYLMDKVVGAEE